MSQALNSALRRIEHQIFLDGARARLGIPVDPEQHARLTQRRTALEAERDSLRREGMAALERQAQREVPAAQDVPVLAPMGPDETVGECERRTYFGDPPRTLPEWL
jgi:hypothetical protein